MAIIIPTPSKTLTTRGTAGLQTPSDFTKVERAVQGLGQQVAAVSEIFRKGIITEQVSKATLSANQQLNDLQQKALSSPNLTESSSAVFRTEADKIISKQMDTIGDPIATREFQVQHQGVVMARENAVRKAGRAAQTDRFVVDTGEMKIQTQENMFATDNLAAREIERQKYIGQLNRGVENLWFSRAERQQAIVTFDEEVRVGRPQFDFDTLSKSQGSVGAAIFKDRVESGIFYPDLETQEEQTFITAADKRIDRLKIEEARVLRAKQTETLGKVLNKLNIPNLDENGNPDGTFRNDIQPSDVKLLIAQGVLKDSEGANVVDYLESVAPGTVKTVNTSYAEIFNMIEAVDTFREKDGTERRFTDGEIMTRLSVLGKTSISSENYRELLKRMTERTKGADQILIKNEVIGLEGWGARIIAPRKNIDTLTLREKSIIDALEVEYMRRIVAEPKATGNRIREIAEEVKSDFKLQILTPDIDKILNAVAGDVECTLFEGCFERTESGSWKRTSKQPSESTSIITPELKKQRRRDKRKK